MTTYTTLTKTDLELISKQYGLGKLENCTALHGGSSNSSYLVEDAGEKLVISVRDEKSFVDVRIMTQILQELARHKLPTERLLLTVAGELVADLNGNPLILKKYIDGHAPENLDENSLQEVGGLLAKLHQITPPSDLRTMHPYGKDEFHTVLDREDDSDFVRWLASKRKCILQQLDPALPTGLVHGDLFGNNTIQRDGKTVGVIDFEEASNYYLIFDLGMTSSGACRSGDEVDLQLVRHLVKGYQQIRQLCEAEVMSLQLFIEYAAVATAFWRYRQFNILYLNSNKADRYKEMVNIAEQIHNLNADQFIEAVFG